MTNKINRLYVSDLDGTLLSHNSILSDYTRKHLEIILDKGIPFTVASARSLTTIKEILLDLPLKLPVITLNGACLMNYDDEKKILTSYLNEIKANNILNFLEKNDASFIFTSEEREKSKCWLPSKRNHCVELFYQDRVEKKDPRLKIFDNLKDIDLKKEKVISFTIIEEATKSKEIYKKLQQETNDNFAIYPMGIDENNYQWTTIQDDQATKGTGLKKVSELIDIPLKEVTVFGDNLNDLSMFELAGNSCAVNNAHPDLKKVAHKIIPEHFQDSVINYILTRENIKI